MIPPRKIRSSRRLRGNKARSEAMSRHPSGKTGMAAPYPAIMLFMEVLLAHTCGDFRIAAKLTDQGVNLGFWDHERVDRQLLRWDQKNR